MWASIFVLVTLVPFIGLWLCTLKYTTTRYNALSAQVNGGLIVSSMLLAGKAITITFVCAIFLATYFTILRQL